MQSVHKDENSPRIVVVGDSILDVYCLGKNDGGNPAFFMEKPGECSRRRGKCRFNIRALGGYPLLFSKGWNGRCIHSVYPEVDARGISTRYIRTCADSGISVKTRYCEGERIFRADRDFMNVQTEREAYRLMQDIQALIPPYQAVVFSDYAKGFCSGTLYRLLSGYCYRKAIHLFVDSKSLFPPAFAYVYKPNWWEFEQRFGHRTRNMDELPTQARAFQKKYRIQHLIVTMDKQGVLWMDPGGSRTGTRRLPLRLSIPVERAIVFWRHLRWPTAKGSRCRTRFRLPTKRLGPPVGIPVLIQLKLAKFLMKGTDANGK